MGQAKDEIRGQAKKAVGKVIGGESLEAEGQDLHEQAAEKEEAEQAGNVGTLSGSGGVKPYSWGDSASGGAEEEEKIARHGR